MTADYPPEIELLLRTAPLIDPALEPPSLETLLGHNFGGIPMTDPDPAVPVEPRRCPTSGDPDDPYVDHTPAATCTCTTYCGEDEAAGCCYCRHSDIYAPCPVLGFGCGIGATAGTAKCDCCSVEQWEVARRG